MPVKAMSKSMSLNDSHIFHDISLFRLVPSKPIQTAGPKPTWIRRCRDDVGRVQASKRWTVVWWPFVSFNYALRMESLTCPSEVRQNGIRGVFFFLRMLRLPPKTKEWLYIIFFFGWMFFFGDVAVTLPKTKEWLTGKKTTNAWVNVISYKELDDFPLIMLVFGKGVERLNLS